MRGGLCTSYVAVACALAVVSRNAKALQPLATFLEGARSYNPDARESRATAKERDAEADVATARLLPSLSASGTYTRNEFEVSITLPAALGGTGGPLKLQPQNQLDGSVSASIPVVNVGIWERKAATRASADSARDSARATELDVQRQVARAYFQLLGYEASLRAAQKNETLAHQISAITQTKREAGTASDLDLKRAEADAARAHQNLVTANVAILTARRSLATLTGVEPEPVTTFTKDDLHEEATLAQWLEQAPASPTVTSAIEATRAAEKNVSVAKAAWLPSLNAAGQERFTNATSFAGHSSYYLLQAVASWQLDFTIPAAVRAQEAAAAGAHAREDKARLGVSESVYDTWQQIRADIENAKTAQIQSDASALAADLARDRYEGGIATQLDLLQARQDAFTAELNLIRAYADLAYARAALRSYSGHSLLAEPPR